MTKEEARKAAEVMFAYANGEEIEVMDFDGKYQPAKNPSFNWTEVEYRVKPKPTYRSFKNKEECWDEMHKHPDFGWIIYKRKYYNIHDVTSKKITILYECDVRCLDFKSCMEEVTFTDSTPFGMSDENDEQ